MVIEAGVAAGYVIAWVTRKARRIGGRLDGEVDELIDDGLDRLHQVVAAKLDGHQVLADLGEEAGTDISQVSELTCQQFELAIAAAARKDEVFGQAVTDLIAQLRAVEQTSGRSLIAGAGAVILTGDAHVHAEHQGIAFGQIAGDVNLERSSGDPPPPGRPSH